MFRSKAVAPRGLPVYWPVGAILISYFKLCPAGHYAIIFVDSSTFDDNNFTIPHIITFSVLYFTSAYFAYFRGARPLSPLITGLAHEHARFPGRHEY